MPPFYFRFLLFCCLLWAAPTVQAQLTGKVASETGDPVAAANVLLLQMPDSSLVKGQVTDAVGSFVFNRLRVGSYVVQVKMIGFAPYESEVFDWQGTSTTLSMGELRLTPHSMDLDEVDIVAQKQLFQQEIDRLVVNVSGSATAAGNTALQVLERAPGVIVDRGNGSLALAGKQGVIVMINGKRNYMPISGVIQLLAGMSADEIEKIELITTPPANFDAEGNAGFINIVLKQNSNYGFNGSVSLSGGYGRGPQSNANVSLNYRRNKLNLYGSYNFLLDGREQLFVSEREQVIEGELVTLDTRSDRFPMQLNHTLRFGLDYQLSKKTILGVLASTYDTKWTMDATNLAQFTYANRPDTLVELVNTELNQWRHYMGNVNLQHNFTDSRSLTLNFDYLYYRDNNPTDYLNTYTGEDGSFIREEGVESRKVTPIRISVGTVDYKTPLGGKANLETGLKATISRFTNEVGVTYLRNEPIVDPDLSGTFFLEEEIGAAYATVDWSPREKTSMKLGLRYEYTQSNLSSLTEADIVDRQYGNLFPSIFISQQLSQDQSINISYSRRISRPTFNQMAPFVIFMDPTTFFSGNAALQPAIADAIKLDYRFKAYFLSLTYTHEDSSIAQFQARIDPETNRQIINAENLRRTNTLNLTLTVPIQVAKWWDMQWSLSGTYNDVALYLDGQLLTFQQQSFGGFMSQKFSLPMDLKLEFTGNYQSRVLFGTSTVRGTGALNIALRKNLGPDGVNGTLTFNVNDVFNSFQFLVENDLPEFNLVTSQLYDFSQRTFLLSYTRSFGSSTVRATRRRRTASDEERRRVN